jgi:hypothetical protein
MSQAGSGGQNTVGPNVPTSFVTNSGTATPVANVVDIVGGSGITTMGGGNTIMISLTNPNMTWSQVLTPTAAMTTNNGYMINSGVLTTISLPTVAPQFSFVQVKGFSGSWRISQAAGQYIQYGSSTTTPGVGGSLSSTDTNDGVLLMCTSSGEFWTVMSGVGNITII